MSKKNLIYFICILCTPISLFTQEFSHNGSLLKINIDSKTVIHGDTLGYWFEVSDSSHYSYKYRNILKNGERYFFIKDSFLVNQKDDIYIEQKNIEFLDNGESHFLSSAPQLYSPWLYDFLRDPITIRCDEGLWILDGDWGQIFITNEYKVINTFDIFRNENNRFSHICGKIDSLYLVYWEGDHLFRLCDLSNSPYIDTTESKIISFSKNIFPLEIKQLNNNNIFVKNKMGTNLDVYKLENDSLIFYKNIINEAFTEWILNNDTLVYFSDFEHITKNAKIVRSIIDTINFDIQSSEVLLKGRFDKRNFDISEDLKLAVYINKDTIFAYNLKNGSILNSWHISELDSLFNPLISDESIFVHYLAKKSPTRIEKTLSKNTPNKIKISLYPNPFNSLVNFNFSVPESGRVKITIYNNLGQSIEKLFDSYLAKGTHKIVLSGNNYSSGVYYYKIQNNKNIASGKFVLLK